jgi:plasmid stabilization system protein ParE
VEKEIIWTDQAKTDLQNIYFFNALILDEEKSFKLTDTIIKKTDKLSRSISAGVRYISDLNPSIDYQKLIYKQYVIIFKTEGKNVFIMKVFDSRQNPKKLKI